jgi:hypothetical protein
MTKKAVIVKFIGIVADHPVNPLLKINPVPEAVAAIKRLSEEFDIFITSKHHDALIKSWLKENNLEKIVFIFYGHNDGSIEDHFKNILTMDDYELILHISDMPTDFVINCKNMIKIAVNANRKDVYPNDVYVYKVPLSIDLIEQFMEG